MIPQKFKLAQELHQRGQLAGAQVIYEEILEMNPEHFGALHFLGVIAAQTGRAELAVELMAHSLQVNQQNAVAFNNYGNALVAVNRFEQAVASYDRAIALNKGYADAYFNRGVAFARLGQFPAAIASHDRAIALAKDHADAHHGRGQALYLAADLDAALESFEQAVRIRPDHFEAWFDRGNVLKDLQRLEAALASYDRAIALKRDFAAAHSNRGIVLKMLKRWDAALASYDAAIAAKSDYPEPHSNRSLVLKELGQWQEALASCDRAIAIKPDYADAHANRGVVQQALGQWHEALASYDRAIAIKPDYALAYSNRGVVLGELEQWEPALASFDRAIALRADLAEAHSNRGLLLHAMNRLEEALASHDRAIAADDSNATARENRAYTLLLAGDLDRGLRDYEWRWKNELRPKPRHPVSLSTPLWLGGDAIAGKSILLHCEQGLGDTIHFARYVPQMAALGANVILEVQEPLLELLAGLPGAGRVIARGGTLPAVDYHCPLMSLPLAFKSTLESIPGPAKYLKADPAKLAQWRARLGDRTRPRIGLAWSGNARHPKAEEKRIPLEEWLPHLPADFEYFCLQTDLREADGQALRAVERIVHFPDDLGFHSTAALCECMDLVITVDTSVAHLSGALGCKTWVLLPFNPDWRWQLRRIDTPWYPTAALYRQERRGDWQPVLARVAADLMRLMPR